MQSLATLKNALLKVKLVSSQNQKFNLVQSLAGPALFAGHGSDGILQTIACARVDDVLVAASAEPSCEIIEN
eukprot:3455145-Pyramimonas_sp.AAC.1